MMANIIFQEYLWDRQKILALANSILEAYFEDDHKPKIDEQEIERKRFELDKLQRKCETLIEMRADGDLTKEAFKQKKAQVESSILKLQSEIYEMETIMNSESEPVENYKDKLEVLGYAMQQYTVPDQKDVPPSVIEAFVERIVVSKDGFDWYLRFAGDSSSPLRCTLDGKRRSTTTIQVSEGDSPPFLHSGTGRDQRVKEKRFRKVISFTVTKDDAKRHLYQCATSRRVLRWADLNVNLYI